MTLLSEWLETKTELVLKTGRKRVQLSSSRRDSGLPNASQRACGGLRVVGGLEKPSQTWVFQAILYNAKLGVVAYTRTSYPPNRPLMVIMAVRTAVSVQ